MNLLKQSLFPPSTTTVRTKPRRTRSNPSKLQLNHQESRQPLLDPSSNHETELGTIDSDNDDDDAEATDEQSLKLQKRDIVRSRHSRTSSHPAAHGGGSIVIVEKPVRPDETLQAFAIRYRVPVRTCIVPLDQRQSVRFFFSGIAIETFE